MRIKMYTIFVLVSMCFTNKLFASSGNMEGFASCFADELVSASVEACSNNHPKIKSKLEGALKSWREREGEKTAKEAAECEKMLSNATLEQREEVAEFVAQKESMLKDIRQQSSSLSFCWRVFSGLTQEPDLKDASAEKEPD